MCKCVVTLSVYPTPGKLKNQPDHGGNRTRDLWFASYYLLFIVLRYFLVFLLVESLQIIFRLSMQT